MKALFSVQSPANLKNLLSTIQLLSERGHAVTVLLHREVATAGSDALLAEVRSLNGVEVELAPESADDVRLAQNARSALDYLLFQGDGFTDAYLERAERRVTARFVRIASLPFLRSRLGRRLVTRVLEASHDAIRPDPAIVERLAALRPDIAVFSPLIHLRSTQPDYLRAAKALGIPTAMMVYSWDNLTSKSRIRPLPDRVIAWNDMQRREAIDLHRVPADRIRTPGAQCFDEWFERQPSSREAFCARVGLDPGSQYILWLCFSPLSKLGAPDEVGYVTQWLEAVRGSTDPVLAEAGVLIRPHPKRTAPWAEVSLDGLGEVVVWPRETRFPSDEASRAGFFDSIYHARAVVGLNTSAMIEAGIIGRPVLTILAEQYDACQKDTLHFGYLLDAGGGLVISSTSIDEHLGQLSAAMNTGEGVGEGFVRAFVRPNGLALPVTPLVVDELESLADVDRPPVTARGGAVVRSVGRVLVGLGRPQKRRSDPA